MLKLNKQFKNRSRVFSYSKNLSFFIKNKIFYCKYPVFKKLTKILYILKRLKKKKVKIEFNIKLNYNISKKPKNVRMGKGVGKLHKNIQRNRKLFNVKISNICLKRLWLC